MEKIRIFISYSHKDKMWLSQKDFDLIPWLERSLATTGAEFWYDTELRKNVGELYSQRILAEIERSDIAVLLISQDFLNSTFIQQVEMPLIRQRVDAGLMGVIPILVDYANAELSPQMQWISDRQMLPNDPEPLIQYTDNRARWAKARAEILEAFRHRINRLLQNKENFYSSVGVKSSPPIPPSKGNYIGDNNRIFRSSIDMVHFSVTSPVSMKPKETYEVDIWAHLEKQREKVIQRARKEAISRDDIRIKSKGSVEVERGTRLTVRLKIQDMDVDPREDSIFWEGEIGNAIFLVTVKANAPIGTKKGVARIYIEDFQISQISFIVKVGLEYDRDDNLKASEKRFRTAFASYASKDEKAVLMRIQALRKVLPNLNIFFARKDLNSGERWQERLSHEISNRDIMYLFWSEAASTSKWVDWEWRKGLELRGIDFIDPFPLVSPEVVPPPEELIDELHFDDWELAYMKTEKNASIKIEPFSKDRRLDSKCFSFNFSNILIRSAKRRNYQKRACITLQDIIFGLVRKGDLTRTALMTMGQRPDNIYKEIENFIENGAPPDPKLQKEYIRLSTVFKSGKIGESELQSLLNYWFVREASDFAQESRETFSKAAALALQESRSKISEFDLLNLLVKSDAWQVLSTTGLPLAQPFINSLHRILSEGRVDHNGNWLFHGLPESASMVIGRAHSLAQKFGCRPISHRVILAALIYDENGFGRTILERFDKNSDKIIGYLMGTLSNRSLETFGLSFEVCEPLIIPMLEQAKQSAGAYDLITDEHLFWAFSKLASKPFKDWLKKIPTPVNIDEITEKQKSS